VPGTTRSRSALVSLTTLSVLAGLAAAVSACGRDATTPVRQAEMPVVQLLSPERGGRFAQNDPNLGCPANATYGSGFRVAFRWHSVEGASSYHVVFWHTGSRFAAIDREVYQSSHEEIRCNAFVADPNLDQWLWTVAAIGRIAPVGSDSGAVAKDTVLWSEEREFGFLPCRISDTVPCNAPPAPRP
jgi:hypothetical protein